MPKSETFHGKGHVYDVVVVGAGISGSEAALKLANAGLDVLVMTTSLDTIANLFHEKVRLNPPQKSFLLKVFKDNNKDGYLHSSDLHKWVKYGLEHSQSIHLLQSSAEKLIVENNRAIGVETWEGVPRYGKSILLAVGSFLQSRLTIGELEERCGRLGEMSYDELYNDLRQYGSLKNHSFRIELPDSSQFYTVNCKIIDEIQDSQVFGLDGLYATGLCAGIVSSYEEAVLDALDTAETIIENS